MAKYIQHRQIKEYPRVFIQDIRTIAYHPTGDGRDRYILEDNGGGIRPKPIGKVDSGRYMHFKDLSKQRPQSAAKVVHYLPTGEGRDNYIRLNDGGMTSPTFRTGSNKLYFYSTLRQYLSPQAQQQSEKLIMIDKYKNHNLLLNQTNSSFKLAIPKRKAKPHFKNVAIMTEQLNNSKINQLKLYGRKLL